MRSGAAPVLLAALLAAGGCSTPRLTSEDLLTVSRTVEVAPSRALALPPPGGPSILSVTERSYENAVAQDIVLSTRGATPGQNAIHVAFFSSAEIPEDTGVEGRLLKEPRLSDDALAIEMEERLPGAAMRSSAAFVQNKYGPFGYAFGRGIGGEACIYAWQRLMPGDSLFRPARGAISVRIRICDPKGTETSLLRIAYQYSLNGSLRLSGWDPLGDAPAPAKTLGEAGEPLYPVRQQSVEDVLDTREAAPVQPRVVRRAPRAEVERLERTEPLPDQRLEGFPTVPPPPATAPAAPAPTRR